MWCIWLKSANKGLSNKHLWVTVQLKFIIQLTNQSEYATEWNLFWCFHLSDCLDLLYEPHKFIKSYYHFHIQKFKGNPMPINRDRTLSVLRKQWIYATTCENWNFAYLAGLICHICVLNKRLGYHIIFYKKIKGNPSTCGRATVLSVEKEKQIILPSVQISQ